MTDRPVKFQARYPGTVSTPPGPPGAHTHTEADVTSLVADLAGKQPLDSDLTAIAALSTTSYGRALLELANQAALLALIPAASETVAGILEVATQAETNTGTDDVRAVSPLKLQTRLAAYAQPLDSDLTSIAALSTTSFGRSLLTLANQAALDATITLAQSQVTNLVSDLAAKAADSAVVHLAGTETITGTKTVDVALVQTYQGSNPSTPAAGHATGPYFDVNGLPAYINPAGIKVPLSIGEVATALHGNASFETVSGSTPTVWNLFWQAGGCTVTTETTDVFLGTRSATVTTPAGSGNNQVVMSDSFTVAPGDTLDVGAWAHSITGSPLLKIGVLTAVSGTPDFFDGVSSPQESEALTLTSTFAKYLKSFSVPAGHTKAVLFFRFTPTAAEATTSRIDYTSSSRTGASVSVLPGNAWVKEACRLLTTAAFAPTTAAPNSVDGVTPAVGDRILKAVAGGASTDGIWTVVTVGSGSNGVWARASDASTAAQVAGAEVAITTGTTYGGTRWGTSFKATDTFGTTAMVWAKVVTEGATVDLTMAGGGVGTGAFRDSVDARVTQADAVGAYRFLANSPTTYTNQTSYAVVANSTERTALTTTLVKVAGFNVLVTLSGTMVLTTGAAQTVFIGIRINGTDYDVALNTPATGTRTVLSGTRLITTLTASSGSWTCEPVIKADTTSALNHYTSDDFITYTIQQVP